MLTVGKFGFSLAILSAVAADSASATGIDIENIRLEREYGDMKWRLDGRIMLDALGTSTLNSNNENSSDWRRARLGARLRWNKDWRFRISADFPDGDVDLRDLRVEYRGGPVHLAAGRMQEPFGMSENEGSNQLALMERPLATALGPDYSSGIRANTRGDNWAVTVGLFGPDIVGIRLSGQDRNVDDAISARATVKALQTDHQLLHLGASFSHRDPNSAEGLRFVSRPESTLVSGLNISHPRIADAGRYQLYGTEFGLRRGPVLVKGEYILADISRSTADGVSYSGYYVQGIWSLTGEQRGYSTRNGVFRGIAPDRPFTSGGPGAWELSTRFSHLDLRGADIDLDGDVDGEQGSVFSAGVNWYPVRNARIMLNALRITEDNGASSSSENALQLRLHFFF